MQSGRAHSHSYRLICVAWPGLSAPQLRSPRICVLALCILALFVSAISPVDDAVQQDYRSPSHAKVMAVKASCGDAPRLPHLLAIATTGGTQPGLTRSEVSAPGALSSNLPVEDFFKSYRIRPPPNPSRQA